MNTKNALLAARHHIVFMLGMAAAFGFVIYLENLNTTGVAHRFVDLDQRTEHELAETRVLSEQELEWAQIAWRYFENNYQSETGLVNSVDGYPAATMWDTASYMLGAISALRLHVITPDTFHTRMSKLLDSLAIMPLFEGELPNKSYNTTNLAMVDYTNAATDAGIGWSAIDVGRVLVPLNVLIWNYPEFTPQVRAVLNHWNIDAMLQEGLMMGTALDDQGNVIFVQEGRIGYEEYAAKSLSLMGYDVSKALLYVDFLQYEDIYGIDIPTDSRDPEVYHAHNYVVSESYILDGLEFGFDFRSQEFARRVYAAQEARTADTGILTAVSEDNIDQAPYFVYNTVFTSGAAWNAITDEGEDASEFKSLSLKAAFGWHNLYETEHTEALIEKVKTLYDPESGWYSGWYEVKDEPNKAMTANTNGIVLESLAYRQFGPLVAAYETDTLGQRYVDASVDASVGQSQNSGDTAESADGAVAEVHDTDTEEQPQVEPATELVSTQDGE